MLQIRNAGDAFLGAVASFAAFLPTLLGAILILIIGWFVAVIIAKLVRRGLHAVGFERAAERSGFGTMMQRSGRSWTASWLIAQLAKWFVFLLFAVAAANVLNMPQVTNLMNAIVLFMPQVIVAIIILILGVMLAQIAAGIVHGAVAGTGVAGANVIAAITKYGIIAAAIVAAANQIGVATVVVNTLFIGLVSAFALALGLAFGLGGREVGARIADTWYRSAQTAFDRNKEVGGTHRLRPTGT